MKSFVALLLLFAIGHVFSDESEGNECTTHKKLVCLPPTEAESLKCETFPYQCPDQKVCCKNLDGVKSSKNADSSQKRPKRKCRKTPKKCEKKLGLCVPTKKNDCTTSTKNSLCKGASCTCCMNSVEPKHCKTKSACKKKGGFCTDHRGSKCNGKFKKGLCKGKYCACCIGGGTRDDCQCGTINTERIIGGVEVSLQNKYPFVVGLQASQILENGFYCGAVIIADRYILTAAHCLYNSSTFEVLSPDIVKVAVGDHKQLSIDDNIPSVTKLLDVENIIVHDSYEYEEFLDNNHDLGLLKLKKKLDLTKYDEIKPICVPADDSKTYEGEIGTATGWGFTNIETYDYPDELQEVDLDILGLDCPGDTVEGNPITENMLCAVIKEGGEGTCNGDSGGALFVTEEGRSVLVGLVSFGKGCALPNAPSVYTRVSKYLDWIKANTYEAIKCR